VIRVEDVLYIPTVEYLAEDQRSAAALAAANRAVVDALIKAVRKLPAALRESLTWDRGAELASHAAFTVATDVQVYTVIPRAPGNVGAMRIRMAYCGSTIQKGRISQQ
jgi:hypothetical protein